MVEAKQKRFRDLDESLEVLHERAKEPGYYERDDSDVLDNARTCIRLAIEDRAKSPAFKMIEQVWGHSLKAVQFSWERLNHSMYYAVELAIFSGMKFAEDDFDTIAQKFRMGYWGNSSSYYTMAVMANNISACRSIEKHINLKPYIVKFGYTIIWSGHMGRSRVDRNSGRLAGGAEFTWDGRRVHITSMDNDRVIACSYKRDWKETSTGTKYFDEKLEKRYRLTREQLIPPKKKEEKVEA